MWGHAFFGAAFFGAAYFGPASGPAVIENSGLTGTPSSNARLTASITNHPMSDKLIVGSTNTIGVKGLKNTDTKAYLANATVVLTALLDPSGATVAGTTNIPMPYISGVGRSVFYAGTLPHTVPLIEGTTYIRRFTAIDATGNVRRFDRSIVAEAG